MCLFSSFVVSTFAPDSANAEGRQQHNDQRQELLSDGPVFRRDSSEQGFRECQDGRHHCGGESGDRRGLRRGRGLGATLAGRTEQRDDCDQPDSSNRRYAHVSKPIFLCLSATLCTSPMATSIVQSELPP